MYKNLKNVLASIKLGYKLHKNKICISYFNLNCLIILNILYKNGYISGYSFDNLNNKITIYLKYIQNKSVIQYMCLFLNKTKYIYLTYPMLLEINKNFGCYVLSTHLGFMTSNDAIAKKIGGLLFFYLY